MKLTFIGVVSFIESDFLKLGGIMEYIMRILLLIVMGIIYILPGYLMHKVIISTFNINKYISLMILLIGLTTFPIGNILIRWRLNKFTSFVEFLGGIFLFVYTFAALYLIVHFISSIIPIFSKYSELIFIVYFILVGVLGLIGYFRAHNIKVNTYTIKSNLVEKNTKILMFADIHLSQISKKNIISKIAQVVKEKNPDLILIAGDIIDTDTKLILHNYTEDFKEIKAPLGVYASVGNHEYYGDFTKNIDYIKNMGINVMYETGQEVGDFFIVGRSYSYDKRKNLEELTKGNINKKPVIVIDHSPKESEKFIKSGNFLQVSGHTHNGQFFPFNLITGLMFKPDWGILSEGKSNVITTCGVGYWAIPIRFPSYAEVVEIDVVKE